LIRNLTPGYPECLSGSWVAWVEFQGAGQMNHYLLRLVQDGGPLNPCLNAGRIHFQNGCKVASGTSALSGIGSLHAPVHERCYLLL
jgi:hypothetical protein